MTSEVALRPGSGSAPLAAAMLLLAAVGAVTLALGDGPRFEVGAIAAVVALAVGVAAAARLRVGPRARARGRPPGGLEVGATLALLLLCAAVASESIAALPPSVVTRELAPRIHLATAYRLLFALQCAALFAALAWRPRGLGASEAGLVVAISAATLDGAFLPLLGTPRAHLAVALVLAAAAARFADPAARRRPVAGVPGGGAALALVTVAAFSTLLAAGPERGWSRLSALAAWALLYALVVTRPRRRDADPWLLAAFLGGALLAAGTALAGAVPLAELVGVSTTWRSRLGAGFTNANGAGVMAAASTTLCLGLAAEQRGRRRLLLLLAAIPFAGLLALSVSRSAALGVAVGGLVLVATGRGRQARRGLGVVGAALGAGLGLVSLVARDLGDSWTLRVAIWRLAPDLVAAAPWLGHGLGQPLPPAGLSGLRPAERLEVGHLLPATHAHDLPLQVLLSTGVLGLVAAALLPVLALRGARRGRSVAALAALAAWTAPQLFVLVPSEASLVGASGWILLALGVPPVRRSAEPSPASERVAGRGAIRGGLLAAGLVVATLLAAVLPAAIHRLERSAEAAFAAGRRAEGLSLLARVARLAPLSAEARVRRAERSAEAGVAAAALRQAVRLRPSHAPYRARRGLVAWSLGRRAEAERELAAAVDLDPLALTGGPYQAWLGALEIQRGRAGRGRELLRRALRLEPGLARRPHWLPTADGTDLALAAPYAAPDDPRLPSYLLRLAGVGGEPAPAVGTTPRLAELATPLLAAGRADAEPAVYLHRLHRLFDSYLVAGLVERAREVAARLDALPSRRLAGRAALAAHFAERLRRPGVPGEAAPGGEAAPATAAQLHLVGSRRAAAGDRAGARRAYRRLLAGWGAEEALPAAWWLAAGDALAAGEPASALRAWCRAQYAARDVATYLDARARIGSLAWVEGDAGPLLSEAPRAALLLAPGAPPAVRLERWLDRVAARAGDLCAERPACGAGTLARALAERPPSRARALLQRRMGGDRAATLSAVTYPGGRP